MRAKEFINEKQVDEAAPLVLALGSALARAATVGGTIARTAGSALVKGAQTVGSQVAKGASNIGGKVAQGLSTAASQIGNQAIGTIGSNVGQAIGSAINSTAQSQQKQPQRGPVTIPPGTKIEIVPSTDPNKIAIQIDGAKVDLDTKDPKNRDVLQKLSQIQPK